MSNPDYSYPFEDGLDKFGIVTASRARHALACNADGEPWPAWSGRETAAVAIVLADVERLRAEGLYSMRLALQYVNDGLEFGFSTGAEALEYFRSIRARVDDAAWIATWNRLHNDQTWTAS